MAGRGTDIKLGEGVAELGGLHVIFTEMHDAGRIDRQLIGRCGRQGDPGTFRQYLALDDDLLLAGLGPKKARQAEGAGREGDRALRSSARPVPPRAAEGRAPPLPPAPVADVLREGAQEDAAAEWGRTLSGHAGLDRRQRNSSEKGVRTRSCELPVGRSGKRFPGLFLLPRSRSLVKYRCRRSELHSPPRALPHR